MDKWLIQLAFDLVAAASAVAEAAKKSQFHGHEVSEQAWLDLLGDVTIAHWEFQDWIQAKYENPRMSAALLARGIMYPATTTTPDDA